MKLNDRFMKLKERLAVGLNIDQKNIQLILYITGIILLNIVAAAFTVRIDLTRLHNYSLSEKSRVVVSHLNERLTVKVLFSKDLPPEHDAVRRYLIDLLDEYDFYGNKYFSYEIVPEDELKSQATDYGINPVISTEYRDDQQKKRSVYMAVVIQHADLTETIDALSSTVGIEYEITSRIEKMTAKVDLLRNMKDYMMLTLYMDPRILKLPIEDIENLEEIVRKAVDKNNIMNYDRIRFQALDPSLLPAEKDPGKKYGLKTISWRAGGGISAGTSAFGLVLEGNGKARKIDFDLAITPVGTWGILGLDNLSERINIAVGDMVGAGQKIAYVRGHGIPDLSDMRTAQGAGMLSQMLSQSYEVVEVDLDNEEIPADAKVVIINGPVEPFDDAAKYKIDQHVMQGRPLVYFVNSLVELPSRDMMGGSIMLPAESGLDDLMASYGIKINKDVVLDRHSALVNYGEMIIEYPVAPLIGKKGLNRENVITKYLNSILLLRASSIDLVDSMKGKSVTYTDLVSTSDQSWISDGRMLGNPLTMQPPEGTDMKSYRVAVLASGRFDSFFKGKAAPADKNVKQPGLSTSLKLDSTVGSGDSKIIVVGCSEITRSGTLSQARRLLSGTGMNEAFSDEIFLHSIVDYMAGREYVPEMKCKSLDYNPLDKTEKSTRFILKIINIVVVPVSVALTGLVIWRRRSVRRRLVESEFSGGDKI